MSTIQELFLILGLVYLSECWAKALPCSISWFSFWGRRFHRRLPLFLFGPQRAGFAFSGLFPFSRHYLSVHWPFSISPQGLADWVEPCFNTLNPQSKLLRALSFEEMREIEAKDVQVLINQQPFVKLATAAHAQYWADFLKELKKSSFENRQKRIAKALESGLDLQSLRTRLRAVPRLLGFFLKAFCVLLFALLFAALPLAWIHFPQWLYWVLAAGGLTWAATLVLFFQLRRKLKVRFRHLDFGSWQKNILLCLSPFAAMRSHVRLFQFYLLDFHPLSLGAFFLKKEKQRREFLASGFLALRHPLGCGQETRAFQASAIVQDFHQTWLKTVKKWADQERIPFDEFVGPPIAESSQSQWYCPRCQTQYTQAFAHCQDCRTIELLRLTPA